MIYLFFTWHTVSQLAVVPTLRTVHTVQYVPVLYWQPVEWKQWVHSHILRSPEVFHCWSSSNHTFLFLLLPMTLPFQQFLSWRWEVCESLKAVAASAWTSQRANVNAGWHTVSALPSRRGRQSNLLTVCISAGFSMLVFEWCGLKCLLPADSLSKHNACSCVHSGKFIMDHLLKSHN